MRDKILGGSMMLAVLSFTAATLVQHARVESYVVIQAVTLCEKNGGLSYIDVFQPPVVNSLYTAHCKDNAIFKYQFKDK